MTTATKHTPDSYLLIYTLDEVKKSFREYSVTMAEKEVLTPILRTEPNNGYNSTTGAQTLLKLRDKSNWKQCTITGLRPTGKDGFYYADFPVNGKKSLMVVYVPFDDWQQLQIRICAEYYPYTPADRSSIINHLIGLFQ